MMSNWCLTASDSAVTAARPPGLASFASVTIRWANKVNSNLIEANSNDVQTIHKSAPQHCELLKSAIRHTQVHVQGKALSVAVENRARDHRRSLVRTALLRPQDFAIGGALW